MDFQQHIRRRLRFKQAGSCLLGWRNLRRSGVNLRLKQLSPRERMRRQIQRLCDDGWVFRLIFVTLRNAALAVERVKNRVAGGGHSIPEADIRRRFSRAHRNFHQLYMPLASTWVVYDNSPEGGAIPIAFGKRGLSPNIIEAESWIRFCEAKDE